MKKVLLLFLSVCVALAMLRLGVWQLDRAEEKQALIDSLQQRANEPMMPLKDLLPLSQSEHEYRRVYVDGNYVANRYFLLDNVVLDSQSGIDVYALFKLKGGGQPSGGQPSGGQPSWGQSSGAQPSEDQPSESQSIESPASESPASASPASGNQYVLVDRGFMSQQNDRSRRPDLGILESHQRVLESHQGALESRQRVLESHQRILESHQRIAGRLRKAPGKPLFWDDSIAVEQDQLWQYLPLDKIAAQLEIELLPMVIELSIDETSKLALDKSWSDIDASAVNKHQAYAFQWFTMAAVFLLACVITAFTLTRKQATRRQNNE